jgi:uncharacterized delta-60 repeat protein
MRIVGDGRSMAACVFAVGLVGGLGSPSGAANRHLGDSDTAIAAAVGLDGKAVIVGVAGGGFVVRRYDADGQLDPTFGSGGRALWGTSRSDDIISLVAVENDGAVVVGGDGDGGGYVLRLRANGTLDASFGQGGLVRTGSYEALPRVLAFGRDGSIVVVTPANSGSQLIRLRADGTPDTTFGVGGAVVAQSLDVGESAALAVQPDGEILIAGTNRGDAPVLGRFHTDGSLDTNFGAGALIKTPMGVTGLSMQGDGTIIAVGVNCGSTLVLTRYTSDSHADASFGRSGVAVAQVPAGAIEFTADSRVVVQPDGRILVGGFARFEEDGSLDTTFSGGVLSAPVVRYPKAFGLQPDGKIVVAGADGLVGSPRFGQPAIGMPSLGRYLADGTLDASFVSNGHRQRPGNPEIQSIDTATGRTVDLSRNSAPDFFPAPSPDGRELAFVSRRGGPPDIYVMRLGSSGVRRLTTSPFDSAQVVDSSTIAWSRDGHRIAFDAQQVSPLSATSCGSAGWRTFVVNADGTGLHLVAANARDPSWSPTGARLAVSSSSEYDRPAGRIEVVPVAGGRTRTLARGVTPGWSPGGDEIAFAVPSGARDAIDVINANGRGRQRLAISGWRPSWSPDGQSLAFSGSSSCPNCGVAVLRLQQRTKLHRLSTGPQTDVRWAPSGRWLAVAAFNTIELLDPTGKRHSRVITKVRFRNADRFDSIAWSSDGRHIYATWIPSPTEP